MVEGAGVLRPGGVFTSKIKTSSLIWNKMIYQTKQRNHKKRVEFIMSIVFVIGVNVCYALASHYFEGSDFWVALKQMLYGTFMIVVLMVLALPLVFAILAVGRLTKRARNKNNR